MNTKNTDLDTLHKILTDKYDIAITENKKLNSDILDLESKHNEATRDLSLSKKVKVEIESSNIEKVEKLTAENVKLNAHIADLIDKLTQLEKYKNTIQSKVATTMEDYIKASKDLE